MASANPYRERPERRHRGDLVETLLATPIAFDDAIINTPVIYGELLPLVWGGKGGKPATAFVPAAQNSEPKPEVT